RTLYVSAQRSQFGCFPLGNRHDRVSVSNIGIDSATLSPAMMSTKKPMAKSASCEFECRSKRIPMRDVSAVFPQPDGGGGASSTQIAALINRSISSPATGVIASLIVGTILTGIRTL